MRPKYELGAAPYTPNEDRDKKPSFRDKIKEFFLEPKKLETPEDLVDGVTVYILGETRGWDGSWRKGKIDGKLNKGEWIVAWDDTAGTMRPTYEFYEAEKILRDWKRFHEIQASTLPPNRWL